MFWDSEAEKRIYSRVRHSCVSVKKDQLIWSQLQVIRGLKVFSWSETGATVFKGIRIIITVIIIVLRSNYYPQFYQPSIYFFHEYYSIISWKYH